GIVNKPTNVFVGPTGDRAKLADFGIARVLGARERNALVIKLEGTPAYMAPEQRRLGAKIGRWTDVYLLARTLGEFLGGRATKGAHGAAGRRLDRACRASAP